MKRGVTTERLSIDAGCLRQPRIRLTVLPAEPGSDVVDGGAEGAGAKRRPERAEHNRRLCTLYQMLVYQMSHGCDPGTNL
jgi:hypothetical protein